MNKHLPGKKLRCKKDLYKRTYEGNAFTKGETYEIRGSVRVEKNWIRVFVLDSRGKDFSFCIDDSGFFH